MTELDELPDPDAQTVALWDSEIHYEAIESGKDPYTARAEAYKLWLEAERDRRQQEGES